MSPYLAVVALVLAIGIGAGGYLKGRHDEAADAIERERKALVAYAERVKTEIEQNDQNKIIIRNLRNDVARLRNAVHFPTCADNTDEANRLLSNRVDALFGILQEELGRLVEEADQLNADAIRLNGLVEGNAGSDK